MKIVLLTGHLSEYAGGLAGSVPGMVKALNRKDGTQAIILGLRDRLAPDAWQQWGDGVHFVNALGPRRFGFAPALARRLAQLDPDIVDVQGLWMYQSLVSLCRHRRTRSPYIITPRGMLDPWALRRSSWLKWIIRFWYEDAHLVEAACIRALNVAEAKAIRAFGLRNPIAIVPNGVDLPSHAMRTRMSRRVRSHTDRRIMLFLGRIHPKKGIFELLEAWESLAKEHRDWELVIAGWDDGGHLPALRERIEATMLAGSVRYLGPRYGPDKDATYAAADAFVLPSHGEGLPMAVLEAWSYGLPVIMTRQCNLPEGFAAGAAIEIEPTAASIARGIRQLFHLSPADRERMARRGQELVARRFTWPRIAQQMHEVYEWVLGGGSPPTCIMTD